MNVSVVIPTRGNVDLTPVVVESFPDEWEVVIYNNGSGDVKVMRSGEEEWFIVATGRPDIAVYARYAAIEYATHDLILTQDDDVIVSDPQKIVDEWLTRAHGISEPGWDGVVCNMPQEFRHDGYTDSALVGFGAAFHRDAPARAFERYYYADTLRATAIGLSERRGETFPHWVTEAVGMGDFFLRTCDVVFTTLTDRVLVDVPKVNREFAEDADRMYRQPDHVGERARMLYLAREARDA